MNKNILKTMIALLSCITGMFAAEPYPVKRITADKMLARIYFQKGSCIICQGDLRPGLDGASKTLEQVILERLMMLEAEKLKISVTEAEIDRYLAQMQKQNGLTLDDVLSLFKQMGFSATEGREQLRTMQVIDTLIDHKVRGKIMIEKKDVEAYFHENPKSVPAEYTIAQSFVPLPSGQTKEEFSDNLEKAIKNGTILSAVIWDNPIALESKHIASDKQFIKDIAPGSIVRLEEAADGIRLLRLVSKRDEKITPLAEREKEIMNTLSKKQFDDKFETYRKELFARARISYTQELPTKNAKVD